MIKQPSMVVMITVILIIPPSTPVTFEDPALLAAYSHPNHLLYVSSSGLVYLPPHSISKSFGYNSKI